MIYLYDNAIVDDLNRSFNPDKTINVRVIPPEQAIAIVSQIQNDEVTFPLVCLTREPNIPIDSNRWNFTLTNKGFATVIDKETNDIYYERVLPIRLSYNLTVLATNQVDIDEIERELLFKYIDQYFLTITLPYESKRKVNFGIVPNFDTGVQRNSAQLEYLQSGTLYQSIITLNCEGAILVNYIPVKAIKASTNISDNMTFDQPII